MRIISGSLAEYYSASGNKFFVYYTILRIKLYTQKLFHINKQHNIQSTVHLQCVQHRFVSLICVLSRNAYGATGSPRCPDQTAGSIHRWLAKQRREIGSDIQHTFPTEHQISDFQIHTKKAICWHPNMPETMISHQNVQCSNWLKFIQYLRVLWGWLHWKYSN